MEPTHWIAAIGNIYFRVKWSVREADVITPSGAEVKNVWSYTSTPMYAVTTVLN
jgi:hypothetical protein